MASSSKAASSSSHTLNVPLESNPPQHKVGIFSALAFLGRVFSSIIPIFMFMVSADIIPIPDAFKQWLREPLGLTLCILILFFTSMYQILEDLTKPKTIRGHVTLKRKKKKRSRKKNGRTSSGVGSDEKLNQGEDESVDGRTIGKLFVSNREIAKGSNGTIVLEGTYEVRPVAVKRLVKAYHDAASKEHRNLSVSDSHPNIVRLYGKESDRSSEDQALPEVKLWTDSGYPSPILFQLMRSSVFFFFIHKIGATKSLKLVVPGDMVSGLVHLHELGMVHRDLKPQNVLIMIIKEGSLCAKLADMGISKRLVGDKSSLGNHATGKYS
ncbi:hypothetical protein C3L33_19170, partial [Rhododendron williamsianum]